MTYNPQGGTYNPQGGGGILLQAAPSSGLRVQPAPTNSAQFLQPTVAPATGQHLVSPSAVSGGGGGGGGGGGYSAPAYVDPYSAWGGKAAYDSLVNGYNTQESNIMGTAHDAAANSALQYKGGIQDLIDSLRTGQTKIDRQSTQNELGLISGRRGVLDMIGRGLRSGAVTLNNRNAATSSAAEGLAHAYSDIGRRSMTGVGNQFEQAQEAVRQMQEDLGLQQSQGVRHLQEGKVQVVNNIVADARNKLAELDSRIAGSNLPNRINIESEKEKVRQDALGQLQAYDQMLSQGTSSIHPLGRDQVVGKAHQLSVAGTAPDNAFNFSTEIPTQFQGTGPFASELPIFTQPRKRQTA